MAKADESKKSNKLIPRCLLFDSTIWHKARELAELEDRSISSYLRNIIRINYEKTKKLSPISS